MNKKFLAPALYRSSTFGVVQSCKPGSKSSLYLREEAVHQGAVELELSDVRLLKCRNVKCFLEVALGNTNPANRAHDIVDADPNSKQTVRAIPLSSSGF